MGELRAQYGEMVFDTVVHENVKLAEAADQQQPITEYAPDSRGAAEYAAIAFELMTRTLRPVAAHPAGASRAVAVGGSSFSRSPSGLAAATLRSARDSSVTPAPHHLPGGVSPLGRD